MIRCHNSANKFQIGASLEFLFFISLLINKFIMQMQDEKSICFTNRIGRFHLVHSSTLIFQMTDR